MKQVIIFGIGQLGELMASCLSEDYGKTIAAFTVDREYKTNESFCERPVLAFEELPGRYNPSDYDVIIAVGYANINRTRHEKMAACTKMGYALLSYVSPKAIIPPNFIPEPNIIIFEAATIQRFATIGAGCIIWPSAFIGHHAILREAVFVGPNASVCGGTDIGACCLIGAGAVVRDYLKVGAHAVVGAGNTLLRNLPEWAVCNAGESPVTLDKARHIQPWPPKTQRC